MSSAAAVQKPSGRRAVIGISDQLLYSLTNFLLTVLVASHSNPEDFGAFTVLVATFLIFSGINRGLSGEPLVIQFSASTESAWRRAASSKLCVAVFFGLASGVLLAAFAWGFGASRFGPLATVFALAMPALFAQDFLRYAALAIGRPVVALTNDASVAVVQLVLTSVLIVAGRASAILLVAAWAVAGACGALVGMAVLRLQFARPTATDGVNQKSLAIRLGFDNLATQVQQQGTGYVIAGFSGLAATAGLRAGQTLFTPPSILSIGVLSAATPELIRTRQASLRAMRRALFQVTVGLCSLSVVFAGIALFLPGRVGRGFFGASWERAHLFVPFLAFALICGVATNCAATGLRVLGAAKYIVSARIVTVGITFGLIIPATELYGTHGAAISVACTGLVQAGIYWFAFTQAFREAKVRSGVRKLAESWDALLASGGEDPVQLAARHYRGPRT